MPRKQLDSASSQASVFERVAWWALLAVPVLVPIASSKVPFTSIAPLTYNLFVYPKLVALAWLVGVSLTAWTLGVLSGRIRTRSVPLWWTVAAFLGLAGLSTIFGLSPMTSFFGGRYYAVGLLVFLLGGAVFLLATQLVTSMRRVRDFSWATVAGGVIVAAVGLMQMLGADPLRATGGPGFMNARGASLLGNPDFTGTFLVVPAVMAAALALSETDLWRRAAAASAFVVTTAALVGTLTRGAYIGVAIGLVALGVAFVRGGMKGVRWQYAALAAAAVVTSSAALILNNRVRAARLISDLVAGESAGNGRLILWKEALAVVGKHPLLGTGPDAYRLGWYAVRSLASVRLTGLVTIDEDPHNVLLMLAATIGIPALLAAVAFIGMSLYTSARAAFGRGGGSGEAAGGRLTYAGWWAALAGLCAALVFATNTTPALVAVFSAAAVLVAARSKPAEWPSWARYALSASAVGLAAVALVVSSLTIAADATMMRAQLSPDKAAIAGQAVSLAPWYAVAREQAVFGTGAAAIGALRSGDPSALQQAAAAEQGYREMIASNPHEYKGYVGLSAFLNNASGALGQPALQRSIEAADQGLEIYPLSAEAAYLKGAAEIGLDDPAAAVKTLEPLWDVDPTYPNAGVVYAEALLRAGDKAKASSVVRTLQQRFPTEPDVQQVANTVNAGTTK